MYTTILQTLLFFDLEMVVQDDQSAAVVSAASIIARMAAWIAGGSVDHVSITWARSGSIEPFSAPTAPDSAARRIDNCCKSLAVDGVTSLGSNPVGTTEPETAPSPRAALVRKALQTAGLPGWVIFGCEAVRGRARPCEVRRQVAAAHFAARCPSPVDARGRGSDLAG